MQKLTSRCTYWYNNFKKYQMDQQHWAVGWKRATNITKWPEYGDEAFRFNTAKELLGLDYWGFFGYYDGGGFVANLGLNITRAKTVIKKIKDYRWIDQLTRALFIEFNVLNANSGLFSMVFVLWEFPPVGSVWKWYTVDTVQLYRYTGGVGM